MTLAQLDRNITGTEQRLAKLRQLRALLIDVSSLASRPDRKAPQKPTAAKPAKKGAGATRAPAGALEAAIEAAVAAKAGMVNREIVAAVKATGYKFSLSSLHVGKTLSKLVADKKLTITRGEKGRTEYGKAQP